jgi:hypothetical protein
MSVISSKRGFDETGSSPLVCIDETKSSANAGLFFLGIFRKKQSARRPASFQAQRKSTLTIAPLKNGIKPWVFAFLSHAGILM